MFVRLALAFLLVCTAAPGRAADETATVFAAASLTESFTAIGAAFTAKHPGEHASFSFGASSALATQVEQGAPADVIATADEVTMKKLVDAGLVDAPHTFAKNRLAIAVERKNPKGVHGLADLAKPELKVVLAAEQVPVGRYARQVLAAAKVTLTPVSLEPDVKAVLTKVALGEADAGIVYATDVKASKGKVDGVEIPEAQNAVAVYPIAVSKHAANPAAAKAFVEFVLSAEGRAILERFGFAAS
jgi:molybdate transport system substrate-binding protein